MTDQYTAHAELDHQDGIYRIGDTAVCTVSFFKNNEIFPCKIHCLMKLEHQILMDQNFEFSGTPLHFEMKGDRASWGYFAFQILDPVTGEPMSGSNVWKHEAKPTIVEDIGIMFEPEKIHHPVKPPHDFEEFWKEQIHKLNAISMNPVLVPLPPPAKYQDTVRFFSVTLDIIDGKKVTGYLAVPLHATTEKCPIYMWFLSWARTDALPEMALEQAKKGAIAFSVAWHGLPVGQTESYYEEHCKMNPLTGVENRNTWNMRYIYFRTLRAIQYMKSRPEWNGKDLIIQGGSLAGSECIAAAALDKSVTLALISVPAFDEYETCGERALSIPLRGNPQLSAETRQEAEYYASANFASLITCECYFCTGFVDTLCPPSGVYAVYNALPATIRKSIYTDPRTGHYGTTSNVNGDNRLNEFFSLFKVQKYHDM